ncbi:MAG: 2-oxoacid:acceptor oxidoreductase family protein [Candidatus Jordarchaeaceae archaeon]
MSTKIYETRWHGRGGQGTVTAARILAEAAYHEGFQGVQTIPFFGAERRGAPVAAYTRFSKKPIRIHSNVYTPDIVVVVDPTLFESIGTKITDGLKSSGILIINSPGNSDTVSKIGKLPKGAKVFIVDATSISIEFGLEVAGLALSATPMLGAFAKATGLISLDSIFESLDSTFHGGESEKNLSAVEMAYEKTVEQTIPKEQYLNGDMPASKHERVPIFKTWRDLTPLPVSKPSEGSMGITGEWRVFKPTYDRENCNKCLACWIFCPESAVGVDDAGYPVINYTYCKGCGICAYVCPRKNMRLVR